VNHHPTNRAERRNAAERCHNRRDRRRQLARRVAATLTKNAERRAMVRELAHLFT
jgi:hypothetical protein